MGRADSSGSAHVCTIEELGVCHNTCQKQAGFTFFARSDVPQNKSPAENGSAPSLCSLSFPSLDIFILKQLINIIFHVAWLIHSHWNTVNIF